MPQPIERATQCIDCVGALIVIANRIETCSTIPAARGRSVNVRAKSIVLGSVAIHSLQVGGSHAPRRAETGNHGVILDSAVRSLLGGEGIACRQVDRSIGREGGGIARGHRALAVFHRQAAGDGCVTRNGNAGTILDGHRTAR